MHRLYNQITVILNDPVKIRIAYDLVAGYGVILFFWTAFHLFNLPIQPLWLLLPYPLLFLLINRFYGVYTTYRYAHPVVKSTILMFATVTVYAIYLIFNGNSLSLFLVVFATGFAAIIPRWFFNLSNKQIMPRNFNLAVTANQPILVVGGGGYIGNHVVDELLNHGKKVRVLDTFFYGQNVFAKNKSKYLEIIKGDITDLFALTSAINDVQAVVHLAGIVGDPACSLDDKLTRHLNIVTTRMLKEQVKAFRIPRFVFASSCSVYGSAESIMNESSQLNPVSLYAQTKIDAEKELLDVKMEDFHPTILRFATVFGHSRRMRFDLVVNLFTAQAYYDGLITVTGSQQWRPFVHVVDLGRAIAKTLEAPLESVSRQVFNVGDDKLNITIGDLAVMVANVVGLDRHHRKVRVRVKDDLSDPRNYHVSFKKIREQLDFEASYDLEKGIREMHQMMKIRVYKQQYTNAAYSNKEMTKLIKTEFYTPEYQQSHFSLLAGSTT